MTQPIIIIGAGLAGWTTARELRKLDKTTPVLLITADSGDFYAKPSLSNAFAQKRSPSQLVTTPAARMAETQAIALQANTRVTGIDTKTHTVHTSAGDFHYAQLVLATGAQPIRIPLAGDAASEVQSVNSLRDFSEFHSRLTQPDQTVEQRGAVTKKHVVIMGAGLIGCEFANDLIGSGFDVTVVDPSAGPIAALLPSGLGEQLREALASLGVCWRFGTTVQRVDHDRKGGSALRVQLASGETRQADVVLSAIGLRADLSLAQAAGLACERGIVVDDHLQTSAANVYALGDGAQYGNGRTLPYVMPIMHAAKALAATLTGQPSAVQFPLMPVAIKTPGLPLVVAPAAPGTAGQWQQSEPGVWLFVDANQVVKGFALSGAQTSRRTEIAKRML
ncbi:MAG: pyridine nucleotide-disulfide oxidoreductase [Comamonadaceae bacterium CG_4_9_14_3_um_filter_60_33]|nr:MAG: pyridine nucleotide-disulfide oxidoreductase [Comamonadaceae bacterium CG2_30_59_20]PIY28088.1 MAG: pyridine nucleotide-disulfide oxidoreductase [Comamonadaceae bacterium CG_4_10_14_3_um_filter_60_42]PJB45030.1 MAG: pyridine nucleotide-disulfide oxidoreductase [Comamonadaceae bacterium CG_4_9_14_3_um_filter_60_33]